ncbi:zeta toxin family protein [Nocardia asteroides]|uniref:zeta toxin family protein n=1 Tax=Nocardia asteroides TaxID=1824 RepID=UPI0037C7465F
MSSPAHLRRTEQMFHAIWPLLTAGRGRSVPPDRAPIATLQIGPAGAGQDFAVDDLASGFEAAERPVIIDETLLALMHPDFLRTASRKGAHAAHAEVADAVRAWIPMAVRAAIATRSHFLVNAASSDNVVFTDVLDVLEAHTHHYRIEAHVLGTGSATTWLNTLAQHLENVSASGPQLCIPPDWSEHLARFLDLTEVVSWLETLPGVDVVRFFRPQLLHDPHAVAKRIFHKPVATLNPSRRIWTIDPTLADELGTPTSAAEVLAKVRALSADPGYVVQWTALYEQVCRANLALVSRLPRMDLAEDLRRARILGATTLSASLQELADPDSPRPPDLSGDHAVIVGDFALFTTGHLDTIQRLAADTDHLTIAVVDQDRSASLVRPRDDLLDWYAQRQREFQWPGLSAHDRVAVIEAAVSAAALGSRPVSVVTVPPVELDPRTINATFPPSRHRLVVLIADDADKAAAEAYQQILARPIERAFLRPPVVGPREVVAAYAAGAAWQRHLPAADTFTARGGEVQLQHAAAAASGPNTALTAALTAAPPPFDLSMPSPTAPAPIHHTGTPRDAGPTVR